MGQVVMATQELVAMEQMNQTEQHVTVVPIAPLVIAMLEYVKTLNKLVWIVPVIIIVKVVVV